MGGVFHANGCLDPGELDEIDLATDCNPSEAGLVHPLVSSTLGGLGRTLRPEPGTLNVRCSTSGSVHLLFFSKFGGLGKPINPEAADGGTADEAPLNAEPGLRDEAPLACHAAATARPKDRGYDAE